MVSGASSSCFSNNLTLHHVFPLCGDTGLIPCLLLDPFSMHRGENLPDLSFPTDMQNVPLFTDHADASRDIHGEFLLGICPNSQVLVFSLLTFMY